MSHAREKSRRTGINRLRRLIGTSGEGPAFGLIAGSVALIPKSGPAMYNNPGKRTHIFFREVENVKRFSVLLALAVGFIFCSAAFAAFPPVPVEKINPGFIYIGPIGDGGWTYMHEQGRLAMEKEFPGVKSTFVESIPEGPDAARVFETMIRNGSKVIFGTTFGYMDFVQEVAKKYPDTIFMHCSGYKVAENVGTY